MKIEQSGHVVKHPIALLNYPSFSLTLSRRQRHGLDVVAVVSSKSEEMRRQGEKRREEMEIKEREKIRERRQTKTYLLRRSMVPSCMFSVVEV